MKAKTKIVAVLLAVAAVSIPGIRSTAGQSASASQKPTGPVKTDSRMEYHGGPIMTGSQNLYVIWYGCWDDNCGLAGDTTSQSILIDFLITLGGSPYFQINAGYPNEHGQSPTGALFYGGAVYDRFSHGFDLAASDIQATINDHVMDRSLPLDPGGIYLVLASADVSSMATGFCVSARPHHGLGEVFGTPYKYAFVGNAARCPSIAAAQFMSNGAILPTPNGKLGADAMTSTIAHVLSTTITNPFGTAWYDRYGLANADKCEGQFGTTYLTANGARANLKLGSRDYLIQQNWVNDRKGRCAMNSSQ